MNKIKVLIIEPTMDPHLKEIDNTLENMQNIVGGLLQFVQLEDDVIIVCNEEGKSLNQEINKIIKDDVICGTFIILGQKDKKCISLNNKQVIKYKRFFKERYHTIPKALIINKYRQSSNLENVNLKDIHKLLNLINPTNIFDK